MALDVIGRKAGDDPPKGHQTVERTAIEQMPAGAMR
jgi:hypothetical protein